MPALPDWAYAHGAALFAAEFRATPEEFCVTETCDIQFSDAGEHDLLWVQKCGQNTQWVADQLARHAGVPVRDVGYGGMKDRHAVTRQWFSIRRAGQVDWNTFDTAGVQILEQRRHQRKLRRGAHSGNSFRIALRATGLESYRQQITQRLAAVATEGVPNYFGEQRFGHDGGNLDLARRLFAGRRMSRGKRSIALSAARARIFNAILDQRVASGSWNKILPGELANLDGSGSVFAVDEVTAELHRRCAEKDIHPSGSLWGDGSPRACDEVAALEASVAVTQQEFANGLVAARMQPASRSLRLLVRELDWQLTDDVLSLGFHLAKGGYATAVLREIAACHFPAVTAPVPPKRVAK